MENKIIYIAGYGRSGTTILDIILSNSTNITSAGALATILKWIKENHLCSCGEKMEDCSFWEDYKLGLYEDKIDKKLQIQRLCERYYFPILAWENEYSNYINHTFHYVCKDNNVIIDSSGTPHIVLFRPYLLKKYSEFDVKLIFSKRRLNDVLKSTLKKHGSPEREKNRSKIVIFFVTIFSYLITYLFTSLIYLTFDKSSRQIVKFKKLKKEPEIVLRDIGSKFDINLEKSISILQADNEFEINHMVGGNRIRFKDSIKFRRS